MAVAEINNDLVRGLLMIVLIVAFLGMWVWAWSGKRKEVFHEASLLPLEEDDGHIPQDDNDGILAGKAKAGKKGTKE